jgi:replicative DNA helicase
MNEVLGKSEERPFGPNEEKAIISLAFTAPEFFSSVGQHIDTKYFHLPEVKFVHAIISSLYEKHEVMPTREMVRDIAMKQLSVDDDYQRILDVVDRPSDPREIPTIKDTVIDWARSKAYGLLYDEEAIDAYESGDYDKISEIFENAQRIVDVSQAGDEFFKTYKDIFNLDFEEKLTTGFRDLDRLINEGGPTRGEVFVWMAPTGVGKSLTLVNSGAMCFRSNLKVLHVTLELSKTKTKIRYAGVFSRIPTTLRIQNKEKVEAAIEKERSSHTGDIIIYEFPPDEISVDTIYQIIKWLKKSKNWVADVVIIDYLELMMSKRSYYNKDDYVRQKRVATEIRGLAQSEHVLVFTATQTNRELGARKEKSEGGGQGGGGGGGGVIDINRAAESYGKMMPSDYVVSINQNSEEYAAGRFRFYVAKNRNGFKFKTISAKVDYSTMIVEVDKMQSIT